MAIIPSALYPGQISSNILYPYGQARNDVVAGDYSGTPLDQAWLNDLWGWQYNLLRRANIEPSGSPDNIGESQYWDALDTLFAQSYVETRLPDEARGTAVNRTGLLLPHQAQPDIADVSYWMRTAMGWQAMQASASRGLFFERSVPKGFTLTSVSLRFSFPSHSVWPPYNAPVITVSRFNMSSLALDSIATETIPLTSQSVYEGLSIFTVSCATNNVFAEDYDVLRVAVFPEYGTNAQTGSVFYGGTIYGSLDRARCL